MARKVRARVGKGVKRYQVTILALCASFGDVDAQLLCAASSPMWGESVIPPPPSPRVHRIELKGHRWSESELTAP